LLILLYLFDKFDEDGLQKELLALEKYWIFLKAEESFTELKPMLLNEAPLTNFELSEGDNKR
jgi:hypothetical protein